MAWRVNRGLHEGSVWLFAPSVHRPVYELHLRSMATLGCRVDIVHIAQVISSEFAIASLPDPRAALTVLSLAEFNHIAFVRVAEQVKLLLRISELADHKIFDIAQAFNDILLHLSSLKLRNYFLYVLVLSL